MRAQFITLCIAGALALTFTLLRPAPNTATFWLIVTPGVACVVYNSTTESRRRKQEVAKYNAWHIRMMEHVDIDDLETDGHLNEWFTDTEWIAIFQKLESMPKGCRSLRSAIEAVKPEIINEK